MDTIFALSTVRGKAGISVVRISGEEARAAAEALGGNVAEPRHATLTTLVAADGDRLDQAIVIRFPEGASYTGEEIVELQLHGGVTTADAVLRVLAAMPGLRQAEPGEFTLRALRNGKMSLTRVEGLADLVSAETEAQRHLARRLLDGELEGRAGSWRRDLTRCRALLEAVMEFADEDLPVDTAPEALELLVRTRDSIDREVAGSKAGERIRDGFEVAIVGAPNVGKSTLLNHLVGREAAITSEHAGTTRDIVEVRMDLSGLPVTLLDTAGLRAATDPVEQIGVRRAVSRALAADLRIFLVDGDEPGSGELRPADGDLVLAAKGDLLPKGTPATVSGKTGLGVGDMLAEVTGRLESMAGLAGTASRERHRLAMTAALGPLAAAIGEIAGGGRIEVAAEEVRLATGHLESLLGDVDIEDVLDDLFSSLCIGK